MINDVHSKLRRDRARRTTFAVLAGCLAACLTVTAGAAPLEVDLGEGLVYFRAHQLPADLPPASAKAGPLVLDLRFTTAAESADTALDAWLKFRSTPKTPVFALVNGSTSEALRRVLSLHQHTPGFLAVGTASPGLTPDVVTRITADDDREAYDALEHGAPLASLITRNADKPRTDEAAIMDARTNPPIDGSESSPDEFDAPVEKAAPDAHPPKPVTDATLQRAIQIHRGLLALKKLPAP